MGPGVVGVVPCVTRTRGRRYETDEGRNGTTEKKRHDSLGRLVRLDNNVKMSLVLVEVSLDAYQACLEHVMFHQVRTYKYVHQFHFALSLFWQKMIQMHIFFVYFRAKR